MKNDKDSIVQRLQKNFLSCHGQRRILVVLAATLLITCLMGHAIQTQLKYMLHEYMETQVWQVVTMMSRMDNDVINGRLHWLVNVSKNIEDHPEEQAFILEIARQNGLGRLGILKLDGTTLAGDGIVTMETYPGLKQVQHGEANVIPNADGTAYLIAAPIHDMENGNVRAILYCQADSDSIVSELLNTEDLDHASFWLMSRQGNVIGHPALSGDEHGQEHFDFLMTSGKLEEMRQKLDRHAVVIQGAETQSTHEFVVLAEIRPEIYLAGYIADDELAEPVQDITGFLRHSYLAFLLFVVLMLLYIHILQTRLLMKSQAETEEALDAAQIAKTQAVRAKEQAEQANQAKSLFLSNMSHEIRTPINAIIGMDEMILRESKEPGIEGYATDLRGSALHLLGLVNDILDFSKIEAGKMTLVPVEYGLASMLNDIVNMTSIRAKNKGLAFLLKADPNLPTVLHGDEVRLKQVAMNILTNAVKYTQQGSVTLTITFRKTSDTKAILRFSVKDTGIGIRPEDLPKLGHAFERIEEERNATIEGTGLGMNITQRLLAMMHSRLEVESVYGKGSTFAFEVEQDVVDFQPLGDFEQQVRQLAEHTASDTALFKAPTADVLVVDDVEMNIKVFRGLLKCTEIHVDSALSGPICLEMVQKKAYDIIFLDHRMPEMDGIETLQRMKAMQHLSKGKPVIALTANAIAGARKEYIDAGFTDYLTKPIDSHKLESMIKKYLPPEKVQEILSDDATDATKNPSTDEQLPDWLRSQTLLDTRSGLANCGSAEDYLETLRLFAEAYEENAAVIQKFFDAADWKNYTIRVHALKSSARIIGANKLSDLAAALEMDGNAGDAAAIQKDTPRLFELYAECEDVLKPVLPAAAQGRESTEGGNSKGTMTAEELQEAYEALKELAATFDYDSVQFVLEDLQDKEPPAGEKEHYEAVCKAAKKPDWMELQKLLE